MPMITTNDLKSGMTLVYNGMLHKLVEFQHIKPGKGHAFVRTKLRNLNTGAIHDINFRSKEPIEQAYVERRALEFLYREGEHYVLMDPETYDQITVRGDLFQDKDKYLKENMELIVSFHDTTIIDVQFPDTVDLKVVSAPPGVRGDTVSGVTKPATTETGAVVNVPLFVNEGDTVRVDTRSGEYVTRV
jgi:elongation factor P